MSQNPSRGSSSSLLGRGRFWDALNTRRLKGAARVAPRHILLAASRVGEGEGLNALRAVRVSTDAPALRPACGDQQICRFTTVPRRYTIEDARDWIARQQAHARDRTAVVLAIVPLPGDRPVGMVGLFGLDEPGATARFGYWLTAESRGQGLVGAATRLVADWAFTQLQLARIQIDREPANHASARVAERLGAVITGSPSGPVRGG
jgi:RimJ/RimL family protein N-acetyltransferase